MLPLSSAKYVVFVLCCLSFCHSGEQLRHTWRSDEMVSRCKPWMSVQVRIENSTQIHYISLRISTSRVIDRKVYVHTSRRNFRSKNRLPCLYQGSNETADHSAFASEINGILLMTFRYNDSWYHSERLTNSSSSMPVVAKSLELDGSGPGRCHYLTPQSVLQELNLGGVNVTQAEPPNPAFKRRRRSLAIQGFPNAAPKKVLELVIVLDRSFVNKSGSEGDALIRVMQIINFVNGIYDALGLRVVLTNIIVWSSDAFTITKNSDSTLKDFSAYKAIQVTVKHDIVVLLSAVQWSGGTLGLAWLSGLCNRILSAIIVSDQYTEAISTSLIMTHEIGHNLGFKHVEDILGCNCSTSGACIMNKYFLPSNRLKILDSSSCSREAWSAQTNEIWRSCLADVPVVSYYSTSSPVCGNGILETGENCDCGPAETCTSKCCNASTCRFLTGAICASGPCCNLNTCTLRASGDVCRTADGFCDVPETCSGTSEWCPSDDKVSDGVECATELAYCYNGQCKTTDSLCQALYSNSAVTANTLCFTNMNSRGDQFGHCDKRLQSVYFSGSNSYPNFTFTSCSSQDTLCGLLWCYQSSTPTSAGVKATFGGTTCYSQPNVDQSSSGLRSPSFVPNGAKCDRNSMCLNSVCTPLANVTRCPTCPDCSGNGVLTASKFCFCNSGLAPPFCNKTGCGGSVTSPLACPASTLPTATSQSPPTTSTTRSDLSTSSTPPTATSSLTPTTSTTRSDLSTTSTLPTATSQSTPTTSTTRNDLSTTSTLPTATSQSTPTTSTTRSDLSTSTNTSTRASIATTKQPTTSAKVIFRRGSIGLWRMSLLKHVMLFGLVGMMDFVFRYNIG